MDQKKLEQFQQKLEKEKKRLQKDLGGIATEDKSLKCNWDAKFPQLGESQEDSATEVEFYDRALPIEQNLELRLCAIENALEKIKKSPKKFGICEKCKKPINEKRLEINPEAQFCTKCGK